MLLLSLVTALLVQVNPARDPLPVPDPVAVPDLRFAWDSTSVPVYDSPATRRLVERVIEESGNVPEGLRDYRAAFRGTMTLALAADSAAGGDLPVTVDEFAGELRWAREGHLHQFIHDHQVRLLVPAPYTLGTILDDPWVIPHLYGPTIAGLSLTQTAGGPREDEDGGAAIHPFGELGPRYYRYEAGDTIRIRVRDETVTLVPIRVRPRPDVPAGAPRVVGSFFIDTERAAVARARFGYVEGGGGVSVRRTGTFLELENGLWEGRYWLPFRQRREVQVVSPLLGGAVAGRIVSEFSDYELNTGWSPEGAPLAQLFRDQTPDPADVDPAGAAGTLGTAEWDIADFADLRRIATEAAEDDDDALRLALHYERGDHFFRYNRVEGAYLGLGLILAPTGPAERSWDLYATAGWAFAGETPRGEVVGRWRAPAPPAFIPGIEWGLEAAAYRRLRDTRAFGPTFQWDLLYTLPALFGGSDLRDYYDATGAALSLVADWGSWTGRIGGRWEQQDSVARNTDRYLFGTADEFPPLIAAAPGTHAALEGEVAYAHGSGAFGLGNSAIVSLRGEVGVADFRFGRAIGLLSLRRSLGIFTLAGRLDFGHAWGAVPPQKFFRFGATEGLRGFGHNEFGGTTAAIARGRFLIGLPPYGARPLARSGIFILPPLRPALVLLGEAGWAEVSERALPQLDRLNSVPTDGARGSVGVGLSLFNDFFTIEYIRPLEDDREGRWYVGLVQWF